ncbi:MAG: metal-dependent hydrolase [Planctomycetes bacterium]|nr:metal-dependent hydrolase [Planctomycetota bacterium]
MELITHALAGSLVADSLPFSRRLGPKASMAAVLAAVAPDLDMLPAFIAKFPPEALSFSALFDWRLVRQYHRGYTHSFFVVFLVSLPLGWLAWRWSGRKGSWPAWALLIFPAPVSHIILDLITPWGVRAYLPFSEARVVWGGNFRMFDLTIMLVLGVVFILNHGIRESHACLESPPPEPGGWRRCVAGLAAGLPKADQIGWLGLLAITGRILLAGS